jgi:hypothetical protein|tara:strand:- start:3439 stop:3744 length:306 start_codon:yes stop_codon:yes gene_type:complete
MGYFRLGSKITHEVHRIGHKIHNHAGQIHRIASKVSDVAGQVGKVAGVVGKVASAALPFTAEIPLVGEAVGGVALGAKAVGGASRLIGRGAKVADLAARYA